MEENHMNPNYYFNMYKKTSILLINTTRMQNFQIISKFPSQ